MKLFSTILGGIAGWATTTTIMFSYPVQHWFIRTLYLKDHEESKLKQSKEFQDQLDLVQEMERQFRKLPHFKLTRHFGELFPSLDWYFEEQKRQLDYKITVGLGKLEKMSRENDLENYRNRVAHCENEYLDDDGYRFHRIDRLRKILQEIEEHTYVQYARDNLKINLLDVKWTIQTLYLPKLIIDKQMRKDLDKRFIEAEESIPWMKNL